MDQEAKQQNMNSNLEKIPYVDQEVYETSNMGIILEPINLRTKEQPTKHQMSSVRVGVQREIWIGGP